MIVITKGTSGSGKSTRLSQLFSFFKNELHYNFEDFYYNNKKVGFLIKEINFIVMGRYYKSGEVERFQGLDIVSGFFKSSDNVCNFIKDKIEEGYSVLIEGAGTTCSYRYRPQFVLDFFKVKKIFIQYYNFNKDDYQNYLDRIFERKGEYPGKDTMWKSNISFERDFKRSVNESELFSKDIQCEVYCNNYDSNINDFGIKFLNFFNLSNFISTYTEYCIKNDLSKINNFKNFSKVVSDNSAVVRKKLF